MSGQLLALAVGAVTVALTAAPFFWSGMMTMAGPPRRRQARPPEARRRW